MTPVVEAVRYDDPEVGVLVAAVQREYVRRYGTPDESPTDPAQFAPPRGEFRVARVGTRAVAMGGWRARDADDDPGLRDLDAELKRMYVLPEFQRRGLARAMLAELERSARAAGRQRMVLETGTAQPEAVALYLGVGYVEVPGFGFYAGDADSVHLARPL